MLWRSSWSKNDFLQHDFNNNVFNIQIVFNVKRENKIKCNLIIFASNSKWDTSIYWIIENIKDDISPLFYKISLWSSFS